MRLLFAIQREIVGLVFAPFGDVIGYLGQARHCCRIACIAAHHHVSPGFVARSLRTFNTKHQTQITKQNTSNTKHQTLNTKVKGLGYLRTLIQWQNGYAAMSPRTG
jgi:hypothetical protein